MEVQLKGIYGKFIIVAVILLNIAFTIKVLEVFERVGNEPSALIIAWFGFTTGELWMLANIKKKKIERDNNEH